MGRSCHISGFLHYRNDLGDGTRTGVVFGSCRGKCQSICSSFRFLPEHPFVEDESEKELYTPEELGEYLRLEAVCCYTKRVGITLLGNEPLQNLEFCTELGEILRGHCLSLHVWSCGYLPFSYYDLVRPYVELFAIRFVAPIARMHRPFPRFEYYRVIETLYQMDAMRFPFRVIIPVIAGVNTDAAEAFASYLFPLKNMKSVILDFSSSGLSPEKILAFRSEFLKRRIALY